MSEEDLKRHSIPNLTIGGFVAHNLFELMECYKDDIKKLKSNFREFEREMAEAAKEYAEMKRENLI